MIGPREFEMVVVDGVRYVKGEEPSPVVVVDVVDEAEVKQRVPRNKARAAVADK